MTECGICNLSFSGNQDLHTHYLGDSHRDRAGKVNHWNCAICLTATTGIEPFHQHLSGQAHLKRVGGAPRVGYAVVPQALSPPDQYRCSVCHKGISGTPNYRQHIEGTGHGAAMSRLSLLRCQPCQESFSSIQEMNAHLLYSPEHMKEMRRGMREEEENQATKWEEPMDTGEGLVTDECAMDESSSEDYYVCIVCKSAKLQGSLEYKKHLEQLAHRIAVSAPGSLNCAWCEETFVDVGDMNRHLLEDEMHLLNMRAFIGSTVNEAKSTGTERVGVITDGPAAADAGVVELKAFDPSELAIIPLTSPSEQYLCSVCGDQLVSGNPNYTQHLDGGKHRKKALGSRDGLKCSWCNIAFESAEDQRQHLVRSNGHFQQMAQRLQMRARGGLIGASSAMDLSFKSTPGLVTDGAFSTGIEQHHCSICNIPISGDTSYRQHVEGRPHQKVIRNTMVLKIHCDWCNLDFPDASKLNHHLLFHPFHSAQMKRFMRKEPLATPPVDGSSPTIANTWENLLEQQEEEAPVPWLGASATNPPSTPSIIKESHSVGTLLSLLDDPPPPTLTSTPLPVGPPASAASQALLPPELREVQYQANAQHYCTVCRDVSTGLPSYKQHLAGAKHRRMLDKLVTGSRGEVQCEACGGHELRNVDELNEHLELDDRHLRIMVLNMPGSYHKPSLLKASILTSQPVTNLGEGNSLSSPLVSSSSSPSRDQKISSILAQYEESSLGEKSNQVSDTRTNSSSSSSSSSSSTADPLSQRLQDEISLFRVNSTSVEPKPADEREDSQDPWTRSFSTNYRDSSVSGGRHQRRSSPPEYYDMEERGLCVLFNFENFRDRSKRREGAEVDANNLRTVFSSYNFEVEEFKDLKEAIFTRKLDDCVRRLNHRPVSCLVVCIMSHGFEGEIVTSDEKKISLSSILDKFNGREPDGCRGMANRPKVFLINACRTSSDRRMEVDFWPVDQRQNSQHVAKRKDFLVVYSTSDSEVSFRDPAEGSVFISNFCDTLNDLGDTRDLTHIITAVNGKFDKNPVPFEDKIHTITAERRDHTSKLIQFKRSD